MSSMGRRHVLGRVGSAVLLLLVLLAAPVSRVSAASAAPGIPIQSDVFAAAPPVMGLGVQLDPYDSYRPGTAKWNMIFRRLDFMRPGFLRVVEPASDYFGGYDSAHNPVYR